MAHGFEEMKQGDMSPNVKSSYERKAQVKPAREGKGIGSRRMFSTQFKLQVLDSYRQDSDCRGNQRATARKYGIHRRQIQKWLQMESSLRCSASESCEAVALNLAAQSRQRDGSCAAGCLPRGAESADASTAAGVVDDDDEEELNVDKVSDSEDDVSSGESLYEQEQALDFTCAALSRRRFYSLSFKLEVLDAFYHDSSCRRNQRATALKFGVHRRQVQKWLNQEGLLRGEYAATRSPVYRADDVQSSPVYRLDDVRETVISPLVPSPVLSPCLDLSRKRKSDDAALPYYAAPEPKKSYLDLDDLPSSAQETALCLVKPSPVTCDVTSSLDPYRPCSCVSPSYWNCCEQQPFYECWPSYTCPYACITSRLHHDAHYYKQAIKDINLYTPLYS